MKTLPAHTPSLLFISFALFVCNAYGQKPDDGSRKVSVTTIQLRPITLTQQYFSRIESHRHIEIRALEDGYLREVSVKECQTVKKGDVMFNFVSALHQAKLDSELAEVQIAQLELNNAQQLFDKKAISQPELQLFAAKLAKAKAKADLARAELNFTIIKAPFDGMIDRLPRQQGSFVLKGETLTTLFNNEIVRAYFNVPEKLYLEYMAEPDQSKQNSDIELILSDNNKFWHKGKIAAIDAKFNTQAGNITFRADFPNPNGLLRHGQTGLLLIKRELKDAILIPQQATFADQGKQYVYAVDKDHVAHRREIIGRSEPKGLFVVEKGIEVGDLVVFDGVGLIHDGKKVEHEDQDPKK